MTFIWYEIVNLKIFNKPSVGWARLTWLTVQRHVGFCDHSLCFLDHCRCNRHSWKHSGHDYSMHQPKIPCDEVFTARKPGRFRFFISCRFAAVSHRHQIARRSRFLGDVLQSECLSGEITLLQWKSSPDCSLLRQILSRRKESFDVRLRFWCCSCGSFQLSAVSLHCMVFGGNMPTTPNCKSVTSNGMSRVGTTWLNPSFLLCVFSCFPC